MLMAGVADSCCLVSRSCVVYSPLCDSDLDAYREYLRTVSLACVRGVSNGCRRVDAFGGGVEGCCCGAHGCADCAMVGKGIGDSRGDRGLLECPWRLGDKNASKCDREVVGESLGAHGECRGGFVVAGDSFSNDGTGCYVGNDVDDGGAGNDSGTNGRSGASLGDNDASAGIGIKPEVDISRTESQGCQVNIESADLCMHRDNTNSVIGGESSSVRQRKTEENRRRRQKAKERKQRRRAAVFERRCGVNSQVVEETVEAKELRLSLEKKWKAENELAAMKAQRAMQVLSANDVSEEVRRYRTRVCAATEKNMVAIEKTHALLRAAGDVTDCDESRVQTVVSTGVNSGTISPNSSVSEAEVRKLQKDHEDLQATMREMIESLKGMGIEPDLLDCYKKTHWTLASNGEMPREQQEKLDRLYPDGYAVPMDDEYHDDGKKRRYIVGY